MGWFAGIPPKQRRLYLIFIGIIATTIPFYCLGLGALALAPTRSGATRTPTRTPTQPPGVVTATLPPNATLGPTPTQWTPPPTKTNTPTA